MIVMHLSGAYAPQTFYRGTAMEIDCRDIAGTNCYCDDEAKESLRKRISECDISDIHFIDSGNYHYISLLWLERIREPFSLILFDHHPDMQPPSFGEITSCGGWVREALETNAFLECVYLVGADAELLREVLPDTRVKTGMFAWKDDSRPIYISLDKDVLREEDARCDWDQGDMTLDNLEHILKTLLEQHSVLGMDVCGEDSKWQQQTNAAQIIATNNATNTRLSKIWQNKK